MNNNKRNSLFVSLTKAEVIYLIVCFLVCFAWSCIFVSAQYGPDEAMRYVVPEYIYRTGLIPSGFEEEIRDGVWGFSYAMPMSLPYLLSALFMKIASLFTHKSVVLFVAARLTSVLSFTGTAFFSMQMAKKMLPKRLGRVFVLLMTLTPQLVFLGSYCNLDSFALFTVMMIMDSWIDCLARDFDRGSGIKLGIAMGLCFLSYNFAYSFILGSFFLYCGWYIANRKRVHFSTFITKGLLILLAVFAVSGWFFIRNAYIYSGDIFGISTRTAVAEEFALSEYKPSMHHTMQKEGTSILGMLRLTPWIPMTLKSTVSVLGYLNVFAPVWVYAGFAVIFLFSIPGLIASFFSGKRSFYLAALFSALVTVSLSVYYSWGMDYQAQGRYIIYAVPFAAMLVAEGVKLFLKKVPAEKANRVEDIVTVAFSAFLAAALLEAFIHCISAFWPCSFWM